MFSMKKLLPFILLAFLLVSNIAFAEEFTVEVEKDDIYFAGRLGTAEVFITNSGATAWFSTSIIGMPNDWLTTPEITSGLLKVKQGETYTFTINVEPNKNANAALYEYTLTVRNTDTDELVKEQVLILVKQVTTAVIKNLELSCTSCEEDIIISGDIENIGTQKTDYSLILSIGEDKKEISANGVKVWEERNFKESFSLHGLKPDNYEIKTEIESDGIVVYRDSEPFTIQRVKNIDYDKTESSTPFGKFVTLIAANNGNDDDMAEFSEQVSDSWFVMYSGPSSDTKDPHMWTKTIGVGEIIELKYSEIFWPTYLIIIIVVLIGALIYLQFTAITVFKEIPGSNLMKKDEEKRISITVKNKMRTMTNVVIKDMIPKGFKVSGKFTTVKPTIKKVGDYTELVWKIGQIAANETRIVQYKIKPTHEVGRMNLPKASVTAKTGDKIVSVNSNYVLVYGDKKRLPTKVRVDTE